MNLTTVFSETAYCDGCGEMHWIKDVLTDTAAPKSDRVPEGTRVRRIEFDCGHKTNVISRYVPGRRH